MQRPRVERRQRPATDDRDLRSHIRTHRNHGTGGMRTHRASIAGTCGRSRGPLLRCPGGFHIDPTRPVARAIITHGHADHARPGHGAVLATPETIAIMQDAPGGDRSRLAFRPSRYGEPLALGGATVRLVPAGHILGSAQVVIEHQGARAVVSGDYKLEPDPTAAPFELVRCDLFVTEATFGLPVFHHEPDDQEVGKLLASVGANPDRTHLIGAYGLGKTQRLIALLRAAGYERPIWLHGANQALCDLYRSLGIDLGELAHVNAGRDQAARRNRALPTIRPQRPLVAAACRPRHRLCLGLDACARTCPPEGRRACRW